MKFFSFVSTLFQVLDASSILEVVVVAKTEGLLEVWLDHFGTLFVLHFLFK